MKILRLTICFILALGFKTLANSNYAVLVQESPVGAGEIKPGIGVHDFGANETVTLTTVANPGWKFVYWLGDVSDPTANRTMMSVDGPKIIIAVFQRDEYAMLGDNDSSPASQGEQKLTGRNDVIGGGLGGGGSGPPSDPPHYYPPTPPVEPVPEPQTLVLLVTGIYFLRNKLLMKRQFS
jgi:hypothetical protein